ncbi:hypothetical protein EDD11_006013 [Mortierella claussenii]|nr:hypothetical protein EDD11_006013 [Mortierella claussenii]
MTFFKFSSSSLSSFKKNKTVSAANTPAQTPRTSIHLNPTEASVAMMINGSKSGDQEELLANYAPKIEGMGRMQVLSMSRI